MCPSASCPEGYIMWIGVCYKVFNTEKTFSDAAATCGEDGGLLAMPRDAKTNAFLVSLSGKRAFWIGLHDRDEEGSFEWVDGSALGAYTSWSPGQPDSLRGDEDCVYYPAQKDTWNDAKCDWTYRFICQAFPACCKAL
uniref:C-type lectin domain-containing protein n=1 Tax=Branchiostoma floridae TaxID=7739 RepID=C3XXH1_BRAFL|eukprot:XP_002611421.1 hypothetical protein BRAFLDRAFT_63950 [Branchiostoma floridae]